MKFLSTFAVVLGTAAIASAQQPTPLPGFDDYSHCAKIDVRKEQHDLTQDEWTHWANGIRGAATDYKNSWIDLSKLQPDRLEAYKNLTAKTPLSVWEQIGWIHHTYNAEIHGGPIFHIWHRHLVRDVEKWIQKHYEPEFKFHYWATHLQWAPPDWCLDPNWKYIGRANWDQDITDGPLANINFTMSGRGLFRSDTLWSDGCWRRGFMGGPTFIYINGWAKQAEYDAAYTDAKETWAARAEVFWLHHSNVDLLWHSVQAHWNADGKNQTYQLNLPITNGLPYYGIPIKDTQFIAQDCVKYAPIINGPPKRRDITHFCPDIPQASRKDCGTPGITAQQCEAKGCCWVPDKPGSKVPWCFTNPASGALNEPIVIPQTSLQAATCANLPKFGRAPFPADMAVMFWGKDAAAKKEEFDSWTANVTARINAGGKSIERVPVAGVKRPAQC
ncbi:hypothetical protein HK104_008282 [Borealophlyctis nickersoniae]|nr:hypothetical protein HK104_008282 [Borealophlyctis nickersoniae]